MYVAGLRGCVMLHGGAGELLVQDAQEGCANC